jgi:hypothetical protein
MKQTEFFNKYGDSLCKVDNDNAEYGDFLILHPEEISKAKDLEKHGHTIVSVHEAIDENFIDMESPCDYGKQPYKIGYYAIKN